MLLHICLWEPLAGIVSGVWQQQEHHHQHRSNFNYVQDDSNIVIINGIIAVKYTIIVVIGNMSIRLKSCVDDNNASESVLKLPSYFVKINIIRGGEVWDKLPPPFAYTYSKVWCSEWLYYSHSSSSSSSSRSRTYPRTTYTSVAHREKKVVHYVEK